MYGGTISLLLFALWMQNTKSQKDLCSNSSLTGTQGEIDYLPNAVNSRVSIECEWEIELPKNDKEFILITKFTYLRAYEGDDRITLADGTVLSSQSVFKGAAPLCIKYVLENEITDCLQQVSSWQCVPEPIHFIRTPIKLSIYTLPRLEETPNVFFYTQFQMNYEFMYCPYPGSSSANLFADEDEVATQQRNSTLIALLAAIISFLIVFLIGLISYYKLKQYYRNLSPPDIKPQEESTDDIRRKTKKKKKRRTSSDETMTDSEEDEDNDDEEVIRPKKARFENSRRGTHHKKSFAHGKQSSNSDSDDSDTEELFKPKRAHFEEGGHSSRSRKSHSYHRDSSSNTEDDDENFVFDGPRKSRNEDHIFGGPRKSRNEDYIFGGPRKSHVGRHQSIAGKKLSSSSDDSEETVYERRRKFSEVKHKRRRGQELVLLHDIQTQTSVPGLIKPIESATHVSHWSLQKRSTMQEEGRCRTVAIQTGLPGTSSVSVISSDTSFSFAESKAKKKGTPHHRKDSSGRAKPTSLSQTRRTKEMQRRKSMFADILDTSSSDISSIQDDDHGRVMPPSSSNKRNSKEKRKGNANPFGNHEKVSEKKKEYTQRVTPPPSSENKNNFLIKDETSSNLTNNQEMMSAIIPTYVVHIIQESGSGPNTKTIKVVQQPQPFVTNESVQLQPVPSDSGIALEEPAAEKTTQENKVLKNDGAKDLSKNPKAFLETATQTSTPGSNETTWTSTEISQSSQEAKATDKVDTEINAIQDIATQTSASASSKTTVKPNKASKVSLKKKGSKTKPNILQDIAAQTSLPASRKTTVKPNKISNLSLKKKRSKQVSKILQENAIPERISNTAVKPKEASRASIHSGYSEDSAYTYEEVTDSTGSSNLTLKAEDISHESLLSQPQGSKNFHDDSGLNSSKVSMKSKHHSSSSSVKDKLRQKGSKNFHDGSELNSSKVSMKSKHHSSSSSAKDKLRKLGSKNFHDDSGLNSSKVSMKSKNHSSSSSVEDKLSQQQGLVLFHEIGTQTSIPGLVKSTDIGTHISFWSLKNKTNQQEPSNRESVSTQTSGLGYSNMSVKTSNVIHSYLSDATTEQNLAVLHDKIASAATTTSSRNEMFSTESSDLTLLLKNTRTGKVREVKVDEKNEKKETDESTSDQFV